MKPRKDLLFKIAIAYLLLLALGAVFIPFFSKQTYYQTHLAMKNMPPGLTFFFGSDELGRSIFLRIWQGARLSFLIATTSVFIELCIGLLVGSVAGLFGGKIESGLMRIVDFLGSLPYLLIVILLTVFLGQGLFTLIVAISITGWLNMARIIRSEVSHCMQNEFILASLAMGATKKHLFFFHILPHLKDKILVTITLTIPIVLFTESFLSFLGLGVQPPLASWGSMAGDGIAALRFYPWRVFFPSFFMSLTMLALNKIADKLTEGRYVAS